MIQGLDHLALAVADLPRAVDFYCNVLGMRPADSRNPAEARYFWVNFGPGQTLNLALHPEGTPRNLGVPHDPTRSPHAAFAASEESLGELKAGLEAHGVAVRGSRTGLYFADPDGNFLEVTCWRESALRRAGGTHW